MVLNSTGLDHVMNLCTFSIGSRYNFASKTTLLIGNSVAGVLTIVCNCLMLIAIWKTPSLRKPSHILIANLALADFLVAAVGCPLMILRDAFILQNRNESFFVICVLASVGRSFVYWPTFVSLYTLIVISVDRVLAIKLKTSYPTVVTIKKILVASLFGWISGALILFPLFILVDRQWIFLTVSSGMVLYTVTISALYFKATHELRKVMSKVSHRNSNAASTNTSSGFNLSKYRRSLRTMLIIFASIMICCSPFLISTAVLSLDYGPAYDQTFRLTVTSFSELILFSNSLWNPLLYFWRMKELRQAAKKAILSTFGRLEFENSSLDNSDKSPRQ